MAKIRVSYNIASIAEGGYFYISWEDGTLIAKVVVENHPELYEIISPWNNTAVAAGQLTPNSIEIMKETIAKGY